MTEKRIIELKNEYYISNKNILERHGVTDDKIGLDCLFPLTPNINIFKLPEEIVEVIADYCDFELRKRNDENLEEFYENSEYEDYVNKSELCLNYRLRDKQSGNLGDIECEVFETCEDVVSRLWTYYADYCIILEEIEDEYFKY